MYQCSFIFQHFFCVRNYSLIHHLSFNSIKSLSKMVYL